MKLLQRTIKNAFYWFSVQERIKLMVLLSILQQFVWISCGAYLQGLCSFHRPDLRLHFLVAFPVEIVFQFFYKMWGKTSHFIENQSHDPVDRVQEESQVAEQEQEHRQRADQQADA